MNSFIVKGLVFAFILMAGTVYIVLDNNIKLDADHMVNVLTLIGALAIAGLSFGVSAKYLAQMQNDTASGELTDENWDGIGEYKNELPAGWAWSFLGVMIWGIWYFLFSPYSLNAFSQIGQWNEEVKTYNAKFQEVHKNADAATLQEMGSGIFSVQCAPCHGVTGDGLSGKAEDLTAGHSKKKVLDVIANGQNAIAAYPGGMPAGMASGAAAQKAAEYIASGAKGDAPAEFGVCAGCHGAKGEGIANVGPKIAGYDVAVVLAGGKTGKIGVMPSFKTRFTPVQNKALETYISSLKR